MKYLYYVQHLLILASIVTGCVLIYPFASSVVIPVGITSSAVGIKICKISVRIKTYKSIIEKKKKNHDKIVLLAKSKLNSMEVLIFKALTDSYISHNKFVNVLQEYYKTREEIKTETSVEYIICKQWKPIVSVARKILQTKIQVLEKLNKID